MASHDLALRSDVDKGETSPDTDGRLRSDVDKLALGETISRNLADSFTYADNLTEVLLLTRALQDTSTYTDNLKHQRELIRPLQDAFTFTENFFDQSIFVRTSGIDLDPDFDDILTHSGIYDRTPQEDITLSENFTTSDILDNIVYDITNVSTIYPREIADVFTFADQLVRDQILDRTAADVLVFADQIARDSSKDRTLQDTFTFTDQLLTDRIRIRQRRAVCSICERCHHHTYTGEVALPVLAIQAYQTLAVLGVQRGAGTIVLGVQALAT
jgi:hypothetical protein